LAQWAGTGSRARRPPRSPAYRDWGAAARKVLEAYLRRIETVDGAVNAVGRVDGERALVRARGGRRAGLRPWGSAARSAVQREGRHLRGRLVMAIGAPITAPPAPPALPGRAAG
jgi:Asp-tRNA(Asn)/Glu-tRNA(Gln) amidotransferase A subunit family amidase